MYNITIFLIIITSLFLIEYGYPPEIVIGGGVFFFLFIIVSLGGIKDRQGKNASIGVLKHERLQKKLTLEDLEKNFKKNNQ